MRPLQPLGASARHPLFVPFVVVAGGFVGFGVPASGADAACRLAAARLSACAAPLLLCVVVVAGGIVFFQHTLPATKNDLVAGKPPDCPQINPTAHKATLLATHIGSMLKHPADFQPCKRTKQPDLAQSNASTHKATLRHTRQRFCHPTHPASLPRAHEAFNLSYVKLRKLRALFSPHTKATLREKHFAI